jgi:hypothetical protein|tara:strand:+ start:319 stop:549 length:231 start_codon:yes stop_codon:yes gene_type:complete
MMNSAELPDSLLKLRAMAPDEATPLLITLVQNDDRMTVCQILTDFLDDGMKDASALLDPLCALIDTARQEGYDFPE